MNPAATNEFGVIWERVNAWAPAEKIALMHRILDSLETADQRTIPAGGAGDRFEESDTPSTTGMRQGEVLGTRGSRRKTLADFLGVFRTEAPPPSDEEVERILEEERLRKYG